MAQALVELFSRFGVPKEIHSDQGSSFKAEVVTKVEGLMGAKPVIATPYHSLTSGVAEREKRDEESEQPSVKLVLIASVCEDEAESIPRIIDSDGMVEWQIGSQLDSRQRAELLELEEFQERLREKPGSTDVIEHVTHLTDEIPCRPRIYSVPIPPWKRKPWPWFNLLKYFEEYTFGKKIQVRTDHNCLRYLQDMQNTNPRLTRWALCIQRYDLDIVYVKASQHQDVDTVSRVYMPSS